MVDVQRAVRFSDNTNVLGYCQSYDRYPVPMNLPSFLKGSSGPTSAWSIPGIVAGLSILRPFLEPLLEAFALAEDPLAKPQKPLPPPCYSGVWTRRTATNYVNLLAFCGVPREAAELAEATESRHYIDFDHVHGHFHLVIEKGARTRRRRRSLEGNCGAAPPQQQQQRQRIEVHYVMDSGPNLEASGGVLHESSAQWDPLAQALTVTSMSKELGFEMVSVRTLDVTQRVLTLTQTAHRLATGEKVRAVTTFARAPHCC